VYTSVTKRQFIAQFIPLEATRAYGIRCGIVACAQQGFATR
jgi:hypothetical protein